MTLAEIGVRLHEYIGYKKISINKLGRMTNTSGTQIYNIIKGRKYGFDKFLNIMVACPDLNLTWIVTGEGDMLTTGPVFRKETITFTNEQYNGLLKENIELKKDVEIGKAKLETFTTSLSYQDLTIESYKNSIEVLKSSNSDLKEIIEHYKYAQNSKSEVKSKTA